MKTSLPKGMYALRAFLGFSLFFALWSLVSYSGMVKPFFLPTPTQVLQSLALLVTEYHLLSDVLASLYRILVGFLLSLLVALPLGLMVGTSKSAEAFLEPLAAFIRYIPVSAFVPLSILWFGIGDSQKFFIIFLGVAPYLLLMVADAASQVRQTHIEAAYTLGATTRDLYRKVIIPSSLPGMWDSMRIMFGAAWTFIILVEIIGATSGLGHVLIQSQRFLLTSNIIGVIIIIGLLGLLTDFAFKKGYAKLFPWAERVG